MRLLAATLITTFWAAAPAAAQTTLPYDHMHLAAPDQAKAVEWYQKNFGGQTMPEGKDRLMFGKTRFIWLKHAFMRPKRGTVYRFARASRPVPPRRSPPPPAPARRRELRRRPRLRDRRTGR